MFRDFLPSVMVGWLAGLFLAIAFITFLWGFRFFPAIRFRTVLAVLAISLGVASFVGFIAGFLFVLWAVTNGEVTVRAEQVVIIAEALASLTSACILLFAEKDRQMGMLPRRLP